MPFKEKFTWISLVVFLVVPGAYFARVLTQAAGAGIAVAGIAYHTPMFIAISVSILLTIVGAILMGIGTGIAIEITGNGSTADIGRDDERDHDIDVRGQIAGSYAAAVGMVGTLALAMLRFDQFWIANAVYLSFVASSITAAIAKLVAYRRGF